MLGVLTTEVFEKFFDYINTPTNARVQLEDGGKPFFPAEAFAKVQAELDVVVVGPPRISTLDVVTNSRFEPINRTITYRALDANQ